MSSVLPDTKSGITEATADGCLQIAASELYAFLIEVHGHSGVVDGQGVTSFQGDMGFEVVLIEHGYTLIHIEHDTGGNVANDHDGSLGLSVLGDVGEYSHEILLGNKAATLLSRWEILVGRHIF